jgi:hypothetical protein
MAPPELPDDIFHMICDALVDQRQFGTLFSCCTTNRNVAVAAIKSLYKCAFSHTETDCDDFGYDGSHKYRAQHLASVRDDSTEDAIPLLAEQELVVQRWSILWRSVILSSMNKTFFPYSQHIRVLNMGDFQSLLDDERFKDRIRDTFFSGELKRFRIETVTANDWRRRPRLNFPAIVHAVGEQLTKNTPIVEMIRGAIVASSLRRWIPRLPRLRSLVVWDGNELRGDVAQLIRLHCPSFNACGFFQGGPSQDEELSSFFSELKEKSLEIFETFSLNGFGAQCCLSLGRHSNALKELHLVIQPAVIPHLGLLKQLTALDTLHLIDERKTFDLETEQNDVFLEIIEWLKSCKKLRELTLDLLDSGAAITTPVLLEPDIQLRHLEVSHYAPKDRAKFHGALAQQKELEHLMLDCEPMESLDELRLLTNSLCHLIQLRVLKLMNIFSYVQGDTIKPICENLQLLEEFDTGGFLDDEVLQSVPKLSNLKIMTFTGLTTFTFQGLLGFCEALAERNHHGLQVAVDYADQENGLSDEEQAFLRTAFAEQCGGRFQYTLFRGTFLNYLMVSLDRAWPRHLVLQYLRDYIANHPF